MHPRNTHFVSPLTIVLTLLCLVLAQIACSGNTVRASDPSTSWKSHEVRKHNGPAATISIPAKLQIITESWNRIAAVPYLAYMPKKDRLLMLLSCDMPHHGMVMTSDDRGTTWTPPREVHSDAQGGPGPHSTMATGLTSLGNGRLMLHMSPNHWYSDDYGQIWGNPRPIPPASNGKPWHEWDPLLVDIDPATGRILRLMSFCSNNMQPDGHFQGYVRFSTDGGATWFGEVKVPQWHAVNEAAFLRAPNGHIVAACRTDNPERFKNQIDHYGGLGVSISTNDGRTWSKLNMLYEFGRHHPSMVLLPDGRIVMSYVVRKGYPNTPEGLPRFGVEAVLSRDAGRSWDFDHRYVLHAWPGNQKGTNAWWPSSQATSTILLPDGSLLTAFGTGYRSQIKRHAPRDVGLVLWRPNP